MQPIDSPEQGLAHQPTRSRDRQKPRFEIPPGITRGLPEDISRLFSSLPEDIMRHFSTQHIPEGEAPPITLEDTIRCMSVENREAFLEHCLFELFQASRLRWWWKIASGQSGKIVGMLRPVPDSLQKDITSIFDQIWDNRRKSKEEQVLLTDPHIKKFLEQRQPLVDNLNALEAALRSNATDRRNNKQKRLGRRLEEAYIGLEQQRRQAEDALSRFDAIYDNTEYHHMISRGVLSRQQQERLWMFACATSAQYFDGTEFATVVAEAIERHLFYLEIPLANHGPLVNHRLFTEEDRRSAVRIAQSVHDATDAWAALHGSESAMTGLPGKISKNKEKLIKHVLDLIASYHHHVAIRSSDALLQDTLQYLKVALYILGAKTEK